MFAAARRPIILLASILCLLLLLEITNLPRALVLAGDAPSTAPSSANASSSSDGEASKPYYTCHDDMSWAVNTQEVSDELGQRREYVKFMEGCAIALKSNPSFCQTHENWRMQMNMVSALVYLTTQTGNTPASLIDLLLPLVPTAISFQLHQNGIYEGTCA